MRISDVRKLKGPEEEIRRLNKLLAVDARCVDEGDAWKTLLVPSLRTRAVSRAVDQNGCSQRVLAVWSGCIQYCRYSSTAPRTVCREPG